MRIYIEEIENRGFHVEQWTDHRRGKVIQITATGDNAFNNAVLDAARAAYPDVKDSDIVNEVSEFVDSLNIAMLIAICRERA